MTLSPMIGMDGDLVDEGTGRPLGADQDADRVGAREGDHAAAAPDLKVADRPLERGRRHGRLVGKVRRPAAIQRVDEKPDVVRAAEAVGTHAVTPNAQRPTSKLRAVATTRRPSAVARMSYRRSHLVEVAAPSPGSLARGVGAAHLVGVALRGSCAVPE